MSGHYSHIVLHVVFSTKNRAAMISDEMMPRLAECIRTLVDSEGGTLIAVGGVADHLHLLIKWRADVAISNLMRVVKAKSSRWAHKTFSDAGLFEWQEGYAVFSVSPTMVSRVKAYIANQDAHHRDRDYREEIAMMMRANSTPD